MKAPTRWSSRHKAAGSDVEPSPDIVLDSEHADIISLSSSPAALDAAASERASSPGNKEDNTPHSTPRGKPAVSQAFHDVMNGAMEDSTSESSVEVPLKIILPYVSRGKALGSKAASQKLRVRKSTRGAESSAKSAASGSSKKTAAANSAKKAVLKAKAEEHRTKGTDPSGASDTPYQVQCMRRVKASKPDFDYLAHSVMFSVSEAEEKKRVKQEDSGDKENDEDSTFNSNAPLVAPRRRGRPPKLKVSDLPEITEYSVSVYIEVEKPPKPKSSRGKSDEQTEGDWVRGPVMVTQETAWEEFLRDVAGAVETGLERLRVKSLRWTTMADPTEKPKTCGALVQWLPMMNDAGFAAFVSNGIVATRATRSFLVKMSPPVQSKTPWETDEGQGADDDPEPDDSDDEPPLKKKKSSKKNGKASVSGLLDLDPFVEKLKKKHVIGACAAHPGVRCLYHKQTDRHILLADNLLLFWANALRKNENGVDTYNPPMEKIFLEAKYTLKIVPHAQFQASGSRPSHGQLQPPGFAAPAHSTQQSLAMQWGMPPYYSAPPYFPMMPPMYAPPPSMYAPAPGYPAAYPPPGSYHPYPPLNPRAHHMPWGSAIPSRHHDDSHSDPPSESSES
ncbi:hypothetical protein V8D89_009398 [Ganoderma adspersum]